MWCHRSLGRRLLTACQKPQEDILLCKGYKKNRRFRREKSDGKGRGGSSNYPIVEVYNDGSKNQTSHMKVPPGYAVLDCGAAKSLCGAKPVAQMAQTCAREGKRVGDKRDTEAIDESCHFRGIGNQIVSSFMKLRVPGSIDGKEVSFSPSVTPGDIPPLVGYDHLIPWGCEIRSVQTSHKQRRCVKTLQMTMTMTCEVETMKQVSSGTCHVTVVLSKQATHAPRLTLQTPRPCRAIKSSQNAVSFQMESKSSPCGPGVHGPAGDADFSRRIPIQSAPHGDRLDLALVGRRPFEILPRGSFRY